MADITEHNHIRGNGDQLKAPFPWFGGKSKAADIVWKAFGNAPNYVEPFAGSLAVLLGRPHPPQQETANDLDGFICNAWRSIQSEPDAVAYYSDRPVNECDLHAIHSHLVRQRELLSARLMGDISYYDPIIAGYWLWGIACWIGRGWCSGDGPWHVLDGQLVHLGDGGQGVNRQRVHLGAGRGVKRQLVHLGDGGRDNDGLLAWMQALCNRLRHVRVCCGDWQRVLGPSVTFIHGATAVFLDPPYDQSIRDAGCYSVDTSGLSASVREWAIANGDHPQLRIALCGYEGEHEMPDSWRKYAWKSHGGMAQTSSKDTRGKANASLERIWFSPHCLDISEAQIDMFTS